MYDICVSYMSEGTGVVEHVVDSLKADWKTWWAPDISTGDWEEEFKKNVMHAKLLVVVIVPHKSPERLRYIKGEMKFAHRNSVPIIILSLGNPDIPIGHTDEVQVKQNDYTGVIHKSTLETLRQRIRRALATEDNDTSADGRPYSITIGTKTLDLPAFIFSLSSHETQITPHAGVTLFKQLPPAHTLISSYDIWKEDKIDTMKDGIDELKENKTITILDSGNYEAKRKGDQKSIKNKSGWDQKRYQKIAKIINSDITFSYDGREASQKTDINIKQTIESYEKDYSALDANKTTLCPIVHIKPPHEREVSNIAAEVTTEVAAKTKPKLIAIPERELGDGLIARVKTVRAIRKALNTLGKYYPLHILGTGNPMTMVALACAGADTFDGLEWCRTVVDYKNGYLFHFQHYDIFKDMQREDIRDKTIKDLINKEYFPYTLKALMHNIDYFMDLQFSLKKHIKDGNPRKLIHMIPHIYNEIYAEATA